MYVCDVKADTSGFWELGVLAHSIHPCISARAKQLISNQYVDQDWQGNVCDDTSAETFGVISALDFLITGCYDELTCDEVRLVLCVLCIYTCTSCVCVCVVACMQCTD